MEKSPEAFRTISEVADLLDTPAHVLRFWESRFPQIRPVKRAGGRRYYRPGDVALLAGIKKLLHDDGLTIRGVQKILREQGIRHVAGLVAPLPEPDRDATVEGEVVAETDFLLAALDPPYTPTETAQIIPLEQAFLRHDTLARPVVPSMTEADMLATDPEDVPEAPYIEAEEDTGGVEHLPLFDHPMRAAGTDQAGLDQASVEDPVKADQAAVPIARESADGPDPAPDAPIQEGAAEGGDADRDSAGDAEAPDAAGTPDAAPAPADAAGQPLPASETVDQPASDVAPVAAEQPTLATLLRRSRRARLAPHRRELQELRDRLADLRDRVAEASRRRIR